MPRDTVGVSQLTQRYTGPSWGGSVSGEERWAYAYDANGNLLAATQETYNGSVWSESEEWVYEWNPRDQMTRAVKYAGGSADNAGSVDYEYCLSCDGALSKRFEWGPGTGSASGDVVAGHRYEYDGLNLLRVDELYDSDSDGLDQDDIDADAWRALWVGTYRPGSLGALLHKSVYVYSDLEDPTADSANEYTYTYDPVGNVAYVYDQSGNLAYEFSQDAFGNELPVGTLGGSDWHDAAGDGIVEHQTGKWMDEFTGLYYFWARWYCGEVGRFTGRDPIKGSCGSPTEHTYVACRSNPVFFVDPDGLSSREGEGWPAPGFPNWVLLHFLWVDFPIHRGKLPVV